MRIGNIDGNINDMWEVVHDSGELTSAITSYDITGLKGDTDIEYQLISRVVGNTSSGYNVKLRINSDSGSNYGQQLIAGTDSSASANRATGIVNLPLGRVTNSGDITFATMHLFAKSGKERTAISQEIINVSGTTVPTLYKRAMVWNNTADELTSLNIFMDFASGIGIGSRFILLRKVHISDGLKTGELPPNKVTGAWEKTYSNVLTTATSTSVEVTGLEGNTDVIYRIIAKLVGDAGSHALDIRPNGVSTNMGYQRLQGSNTTVNASRGTDYQIGTAYANGLNHVGLIDILFYAKAGYERIALSKKINDIDGTTIESIELRGVSWNDITTEVTSLEFSFGAVHLDAQPGTLIEVYKLNL